METVRKKVASKITGRDKQTRFLQRLGLENTGVEMKKDMADLIMNVPWSEMKRTLLVMDMKDLVEEIEKTTLITEGKARIDYWKLHTFDWPF